jgi:hypothetical protein
MKDSDNPPKVSIQLGVHNLTREEIAVALPHYPLQAELDSKEN